MPSDSLLSLSLEQQIGQFFFIGLPGTELDAEARTLLQEVQPGGGYSVNHGRYTYLFGPDNKPIALLPADKSADEVASELDKWVK